MDKENANTAGRRISTFRHSTPRMRCSNTFHNTTNKEDKSFTSDNVQVKKSKTEEDMEDFSFQKLRGAVQSFEKTQKEHFSLSNVRRVTSSSQQQHTQQRNFSSKNIRKVTSSLLERQRKEHKYSEEDVQQSDNSGKRKPLLTSGLGATSAKPVNPVQQGGATQPPLSPPPTNDQDFSFQALKKKALKMEGNKAKKSKDEDDFSFQKLREKAITIEKQGSLTPNRDTHRHKRVSSTSSQRNRFPTPIRASTPTRTTALVRTPIRNARLPPSKRSISTTPQTKNRSSKNIGDAPPPTCTQQIPLKSGSAQYKQRSTTPARTAGSGTFNPTKFRFSSKIKKEEVQATDNSIASVQKLSQWLSDDPFDKKKQVLIRKGVQITRKSKTFEHEDIKNGRVSLRETRVQREREHFPEGKVSNGKNWLQNAFGEREEKDEEPISSVLEKQRMIQNAFKKKSSSSHF